MTPWTRFYEYKMTPLYLANLEGKYRPFLDLIVSMNPSSLIEAGCGTGNITRLLANDLPNADFTCVDRDAEMLTLCEKNLRGSKAEGRTRVERLDITARACRDQEWSVVHSHGVLEHFDENTIRHIIANQLCVSSNLLHCVPSSKYGSKSYGDERLLSPNQWKRICNPSRIIEFNQGFDLALVWE